jgi:hypothetical protein
MRGNLAAEGNPAGFLSATQPQRLGRPRASFRHCAKGGYASLARIPRATRGATIAGLPGPPGFAPRPAMMIIRAIAGALMRNKVLQGAKLATLLPDREGFDAGGDH